MQIHIVKPGQTLYAIGREYGVPPGLIARYNGLREPYRLAVGQALLILRPKLTYQVQQGDTLYTVGKTFGVSLRDLYRNNPNLSGSDKIYPGQVLVIRLESVRRRSIRLSGYAYPYVTQATLRGILPYAAYLSPFTYGFTAEGDLIDMEDEGLLALAAESGTKPLLHLSTLTETGGFSSVRAAQVFASPAVTERLAEQTAAKMAEKGYQGVDLDFEFLGRPLAADYARFAGLLREKVHRAGGILITALAPKTADDQPGVLYEGHDYRRLGESSDGVLLMTYEWGYSAGPPMAVAPLDAVRRVVDYALTRIPREKIFLGFSNYGYDWTLPYKAGETRAEVLGNEQAVQLAVQVGAEIRYDRAAQTPWFTYTDGAGQTHQVFFEDPRSARAKLELIGEYGLAGLGVWNFMRPFTAGFSLANYLYDLA